MLKNSQTKTVLGISFIISESFGVPPRWSLEIVKEFPARDLVSIVTKTDFSNFY